MKRTSRKVSDETRRKISEALKGRTKTMSHRKALSVAFTRYWATIPIEENITPIDHKVITSQRNKTYKNVEIIDVKNTDG